MCWGWTALHALRQSLTLPGVHPLTAPQCHALGHTHTASRSLYREQRAHTSSWNLLDVSDVPTSWSATALHFLNRARWPHLSRRWCGWAEGRPTTWRRMQATRPQFARTTPVAAVTRVPPSCRTDATTGIIRSRQLSGRWLVGRPAGRRGDGRDVSMSQNLNHTLSSAAHHAPPVSRRSPRRTEGAIGPPVIVPHSAAHVPLPMMRRRACASGMLAAHPLHRHAAPGPRRRDLAIHVGFRR